MTFSIVGCDLAVEACGVAVASKFLAVGSVVPWLEAGIGAVATQSLANTTYGPHGLALLRAGSSAREAVDQLVAADPERTQRQVGVVDARGRAATHTGAACGGWSGGRAGRTYAAQGNVLAGPAVIDRMAEVYETGTGSLARRLLGALRAGDVAGGDRRGRQSAALAIVSPAGGYAGFNDRTVDLRVDDHPDPVVELGRLLDLHELYYTVTPDEGKLPLDGELAAEVAELLKRAGHPPAPGDEGFMAALRDWVGFENLEGRWWGEPSLDPVVLERLRAAAQES